MVTEWSLRGGGYIGQSHGEDPGTGSDSIGDGRLEHLCQGTSRSSHWWCPLWYVMEFGMSFDACNKRGLNGSGLERRLVPDEHIKDVHEGGGSKSSWAQ